MSRLNTNTKPKISILGMGYVGIVTGATFAKYGYDTTLVDIIPDKVAAINAGRVPFYEPELEPLVRTGIDAGLLRASSDVVGAVEATDYSFICVGTPATSTGAIDLSQVCNVAELIGKGLKEREEYHVVVTKSTVVPGTTDTVIIPTIERVSGKSAGKNFGVCVNPEFLKEGSAVQDSLNPDRVVIGELDSRSGDGVQSLYGWYKGSKLRMDLVTAEMVKYASNAFLATKITFANELANICERYNVDVYEVMQAVALDSRINPQFLRAGCGFGGSCFPKDLKALVAAAKSKNVEPKLLGTVVELNATQPYRVIELAKAALDCKSLKGKRITVLGLTFKPDTDDIRDTRALPIVTRLIEEGALVTVYDPKGMHNFQKILATEELKVSWGKNLVYASSLRHALTGADACIIQTEWDEFKSLTAVEFKRWMNTPIVIDGRRTFTPTELIAGGVTYLGIGWKNIGY